MLEERLLAVFAFEGRARGDDEVASDAADLAVGEGGAGVFGGEGGGGKGHAGKEKLHVGGE